MPNSVNTVGLHVSSHNPTRKDILVSHPESSLELFHPHPLLFQADPKAIPSRAATGKTDVRRASVACEPLVADGTGTCTV
jgi:hypothetical protein